MPVTKVTTIHADGRIEEQQRDHTRNPLYHPKASGTLKPAYQCVVRETLPVNKTSGLMGINGIPVEAISENSCPYAIQTMANVNLHMADVLKDPIWQDLTFNHPIYQLKEFPRHTRPLWLHCDSHEIVVSYKEPVRLVVKVEKLRANEFVALAKQRFVREGATAESDETILTAASLAETSGSCLVVEAPNKDFLDEIRVDNCGIDVLVSQEKLTRQYTPPLANEVRYLWRMHTNRGALWSILPIESTGDDINTID